MGKVGSYKRLAVGGLVVTALTAVALVASSLAGAAKVTPELFDGPGNKSCGQLQGAGQSWTELKVDPNVDGVHSDGTLTVTITHTQADKVFDWSSNIGVDAVFVKGGSDGSYLYRYDPPSEETSDTGLTSPGQNSISHISFCYDVEPKGSLTVIKTVVNDNGGTAVAGNWTMNVAGPTPLSFPGAGAPGTTSEVNAGSYTVTESGGPSGYALTYSGDCNSSGQVTVPANGSATCTLTNDDQPATLIVEKTVVNDHGGTKGAADFSFQVNGGSAVAFEADGENQLTVNAGTYDVTEPAVDGYATSYSNCSNIQLAPGGSATCEITNNDQPATLTVVKTVVNDDGGSKVAADFPIQVSGTNPSPSSFAGSAAGTQVAIGAGSYSVTETEDPGYTASYSTGCSGTLELGGSATCTITNDDEPGSLTVIKTVVNDNGGTALAGDWTMNVSGPTPLSFAGAEAPGVTNTVDAGSYTIGESGGPSGYALSYAGDCDAGGNVTVAPGQSRTCTLTNDDQPATLVVRKVVVNDSGGTATAADFSFSVNGAAAVAFEADGQNELAVAAGTYSVTEPAVAGYGTTYDNCEDIEVAPGETETCTVTNDDEAATLIVRKVVVNDDGGTASADDFSFQVNGGSAVAFEADGENQLSVSAGTYSVTEPAVDGYATSYENCSQLQLALGQTAVCTVTNDDEPATLIVRKVVVNDDGGTATAADFSFQVNGGAAQAFEADGENQLTVDAGTYDVTEPAVGGYATSYSNCSEVAIPNGGQAICTITNDDRPSTLIVRKVVVNDDGGTASADDFSFSVNGGPAVAFGADGENELAVAPGTYSVTEPAVAGYATSYSNCSDVEVSLGETETCTITNDDEPATLIVRKVVVNDDGGAASADDFSFQVNGGSAVDFEADGENELTVDAGTYSVTEPTVDGYETSYDNCSQLAIPNGGQAICTITNDDEPATLIVRKVVVNDNGGTATAGDFSFRVNGGTAQAFEADGQNDLTVAAGAYDVTEPAVAGYTTTYQGCADIVLPAGGSATCTITNNDVPRGQGSIDVSKSASPTTIKEPGGAVTYSVTITNTSADVDVAITNVVDDRFGDLDDTDGNGCFDVPVNLAPGEKVNCTFTKQITGTGGTSHVNVVTATGVDENGNSVSDSDDARVDITERLIDLVITKEATSPTPLNGIVNYSLTVTNKGPDTATNVQLADPAPAGITYLTANPSQGTCNLSAALITCNLGSLAAGQTVTIAITGRATAVGSHTNTATVTGSGGRETNPGDNVDSALTVVPAPLTPPTPESTPTPAPAVCLTLTVSPKMIKADGKPDKVTAKVTAGKKRVKGVKVSVRGAGVAKTARTNRKGVAVLRINPRKPGIVTVTVVESNQKLCGPKRIGVVGVFLPPLTG